METQSTPKSCLQLQ